MKQTLERTLMDDLQEGLDVGKIQFRDKWQFELKSDLFPLSYHRNNVINQEFYFFLPNSLQINEDTYPNAQFYKDQTNLIRLKTPSFTFKELIDLDNAESPLVRIQMLSDYEHTQEVETSIIDEIKLLGTIFHSAMRDRLADFTQALESFSKSDDAYQFSFDFNQFCDQIEQFHELFVMTNKKCMKRWTSSELDWTFSYIEEYMSVNVKDYFSVFLYDLRQNYSLELKNVDTRICQLILKQTINQQNGIITQKPQHEEYVLYRKGLLSKFVIDPLLVNVSRTSFSQRYRNVIGAIPAGVAMFVYLLILVTWQGRGQGNFLVINSQSLILLTVILYILKDRIKEELKSLSHQKATKWFSDYTTEIKKPDEKAVLGTLKESFSFIAENKVPQEIMEMRNRQFHSVLESFKRPEKIIYYKKVVNIQKKPKTMESRFYGLNIIFRLDIHHFLTKAEDPLHTYLSLDAETFKLHKVQLPRVYHINIILKNTTRLPDGKERVVWDKYRLIVDKSGIKRIEEV
jgi:hypothetical protein